MKTFLLPYGDKTISVQVPERNLALYAVPREAPVLENLPDSIEKIVENPVDSISLSLWAGKKDSVAILCDDYTRPTPSAPILEVVLDILHRKGLSREQITVLICGGLHRKMSEKDLVDKLGSHVVDNYRVVLHDAAERRELALVGKTGYGTPVWVNRAVADADRVLGIGMITTHFLSGYGGGPKIILPGASGEETTYHNHARVAVCPSSRSGT